VPDWWNGGGLGLGDAPKPSHLSFEEFEKAHAAPQLQLELQGDLEQPALELKDLS
jgi:hypothetical protein